MVFSTQKNMLFRARPITKYNNCVSNFHELHFFPYFCPLWYNSIIAEVPVRSRGRAKRDFFKFKNRLSKSSSAHSMAGDRRSNVSDTYSEAVSLAPSEPLPESKSEKRKSKIEKVNNGLRNFLTELRTMSADRIRSASQNRGTYYFVFIFIPLLK